MQLFEPEQIQQMLSDWGLSKDAIAVLSKEPEIVENLRSARALPPFSSDYVPSVVEVLFDGLVYIRSEHGHVVYDRPCSPDYEPPFVEYCFDEQTALFHVNGEIVVDRIDNMAFKSTSTGEVANSNITNG